MTFFCKVGNVPEQTSVGQYSYTGFGFKPQAIIPFSNSASDGWNLSFAIQMGISSGANCGYGNWCQYGFGGSAKNGVSPSNAHRVNDQTAMFSCEWGGTEYGRAGAWTMDTDGFTINWDTVGTSGRRLGYLAIGGTDVTNTIVVIAETPAGAGTMAVTGVGFKPDLVILMGNESHTIDSGYNDSHGTNFLQEIGAFNSKGEQWAKYSYSGHNVNPTQTGTIQTTNYCWIGSAATTTVKRKAHFVSMDSDGFTIYFDTNDAVHYIWALCIKGPQTSIGAWNKSTGSSGVTETVTTSLPNAVQGVLLLTNSKTTSDATRQAGMRHSMGASDGTNYFNCIATDQDNVATSVANGYNNSTTAIGVCDNDVHSRDAYATVGNFQVSTFDVTWTLNNAVATQILYIAFGAGAVNKTWTQSVVPTLTSAINAVTKGNTKTITTVPDNTSGVNAVTSGSGKVITIVPNLTSGINAVSPGSQFVQTVIPNETTAVIAPSIILSQNWLQSVIPNGISGINAVTPGASFVQAVIPNGLTGISAPTPGVTKILTTVPNNTSGINAVSTAHSVLLAAVAGGYSGGAVTPAIEVKSIVTTIPNNYSGINAVALDKTLLINTVAGGSLTTIAPTVGCDRNMTWVQSVIPNISSGIIAPTITNTDKKWVQVVIPNNFSTVNAVTTNSDLRWTQTVVPGGVISLPLINIYAGVGEAIFTEVVLPTVAGGVLAVPAAAQPSISNTWIQQVIPNNTIDSIPGVTPSIQQNATVTITVVSGGTIVGSTTIALSQSGRVWTQTVVPNGVIATPGLDNAQIHQNKTWIQTVTPGIVAKTQPVRPLKWNPFFITAPTITLTERATEIVELDGKSQGDVYLNE